MPDRITPIRTRRVIIVGGRAQEGEPAIETEETTTIIGDQTEDQAVIRRTCCSGCGRVLGEETVAAVCVSCGGLLCEACSENRCFECYQICCWSCSDSVFGRPERYCHDHFGLHFWAFMVQFILLSAIVVGGMLGILHLVGAF
ncbi:MAG: hypothetical protein HYX88_02290 [Chloroflexi bacterium]|nr:hypothetical protein [Chloroflexota bacterium]